jgi:hypothetical protein
MKKTGKVKLKRPYDEIKIQKYFPSALLPIPSFPPHEEHPGGSRLFPHPQHLQILSDWLRNNRTHQLVLKLGLAGVVLLIFCFEVKWC